MVMAMILQNFDMQLDDPAYQLRIQQALTIKPKDLFIRVSLREGSPTDLDQKIHSNGQAADPKQQPKQATTAPRSTKVARANILIAYGSNTGTCQAFAQRLASDAIAHGFEPEVKEMDAIVNNMPKQCPIIFITSSYEGQPPDNAARFVEWLKSSEEKLDGVRFAVFGCGHSKYKICGNKLECMLIGFARRLVDDIPSHTEIGRPANGPAMRSKDCLRRICEHRKRQCVWRFRRLA